MIEVDGAGAWALIKIVFALGIASLVWEAIKLSFAKWQYKRKYGVKSNMRVSYDGERSISEELTDARYVDLLKNSSNSDVPSLNEIFKQDDDNEKPVK